MEVAEQIQTKKRNHTLLKMSGCQKPDIFFIPIHAENAIMSEKVRYIGMA